MLQFSSLKTVTPRASELVGETLDRVGRRGKYLLFELGGAEDPRPPLPGRTDGRRAAAEEDEAPRRGGPSPVRQPHDGAREGVRPRAEGGVVGARGGGRRAADQARAGARFEGVRRDSYSRATTGGASTRSCGTSGRSPASAAATPTTSCTARCCRRTPRWDRSMTRSAGPPRRGPRGPRRGAGAGAATDRRAPDEDRRPLHGARALRGAVPALWGRPPPGLLRVARGDVLPDLPDRRQGPRGPAALRLIR